VIFHIFNWFVYCLLSFKCYLASASPLEEVLASFVKKGKRWYLLVYFLKGSIFSKRVVWSECLQLKKETLVSSVALLQGSFFLFQNCCIVWSVLRWRMKWSSSVSNFFVLSIFKKAIIIMSFLPHFPHIFRKRILFSIVLRLPGHGLQWTKCKWHRLV
jgi:hypothetical protein